jgi:hypothetical protein
MTERAQKVIDAAHRVVDGGVPLGKLIREGRDPMIKKTHYEFAAVLREVVNQLQYQSFHHTEEYYQLDASDILELANELEAL